MTLLLLSGVVGAWRVGSNIENTESWPRVGLQGACPWLLKQCLTLVLPGTLFGQGPESAKTRSQKVHLYFIHHCNNLLKLP